MTIRPNLSLTSPHQLLRYRVDRLEEAVGALHGEISLMDTYLRSLTLAAVRIKLALKNIDPMDAATDDL